MSTPLFIGLTRQVTFAGLPVMYLVCMNVAVMLVFILSKSFLMLILSAIFSYVVLRAVAAYDPKIIGVFIIAVQKTRMSPGLWNGKGVIYHA